jgi:polyhydroxyalkanoate synthesis regulator phasin
VNRFGDIVQKAFYLGVGAVTAAGEEAGSRFGKLRVQAQKLADELVAKGEMTTEEARKLVDELVRQAQQQQQVQSSTNVNSVDRVNTPTPEPRQIEIISEDEASGHTTDEDNVDTLRQQVQAMQDELRRLKRES